jgi:hypothetical protein
MTAHHQELADALGNRYAVFYNPSVPVTNLIPTQTLAVSVGIVNRLLKIHGRNVTSWPGQQTYEIARLVRANWIYQNLSVEPIRKPFLVHQQPNGLIIDCGDTRFMALQALGKPCQVSVILSCTLDCAANYSQWRRILSSAELIDCLGFDPHSAKVMYTTAPATSSHAFLWLEVGDNSTMHHLHSVQQRLNMAQNYLDQQSKNFEFDTDWITTAIDCNKYDN